MSSDIKIKVQSFGRFLSNMVMPNIGAFIAWGKVRWAAGALSTSTAG